MADETHYVGGQAVVEGVMMRGRDVWAVAVRTPDGDIDVQVNEAPTWAQRWSKVPLARGVVALAESLSLGMRALSWSANRAAPEEHQLSRRGMVASVVGALLLFTGLFIVFPALVTKGAGRLFASGLAFNLAEGLLRLALFVGYLLAIGRVADVRRVFEYHGAEHKAIAAYENDVELTPERAQRFTTQHVRCGTNFLLTVLVITIAVYAVFGRPSWPVLLATRALLVPVVAAIAYELIRLAAKHMDRSFVRRLMVPGLALQRLTTREPSLDQLEVAIAALRAALTIEQRAEVDARVPEAA